MTKTIRTDFHKIHWSETVDFYVTDTEVGWAELIVEIEQGTEVYAFSMVFDPRFEIRDFYHDVERSGTASMYLRGEPGGVEVKAEPSSRQGWIKIMIWLVDHGSRRDADFAFHCPKDALLRSMKTKIGFLADGYVLEDTLSKDEPNEWKSALTAAAIGLITLVSVFAFARFISG
ncbi:MAG: hypothetical protein AAF198_09505 [Pseudomonadota bacterium]